MCAPFQLAARRIRCWSMTEGVQTIGGVLAGLAMGVMASVPAFAQAAPAPSPQSVTIGYVELADDPRYENTGAFAGIQFYTLARPIAGAEVATDDAQDVGRLMKMNFHLQKSSGAD